MPRPSVAQANVTDEREDRAMTVARFVIGFFAIALFADTSIAQPVAPVRPVTDTYFGTPVVDPYRYMETGGPDFDAYLRSQNAYTRSKLDALPARRTLLTAMKASIAAAGETGRLDLIAGAASRVFIHV